MKKQLAAVAALLAIAGTLLTGCITNDNCPDVTLRGWWGSSEGQGVTYADGRTPTTGTMVSGTVFRPSDTVSYPGARPAIVIVHGGSEDECHQRWTAEALAGHGYVTMTFSAPINSPDTTAAINFLLSADDPFISAVDPTRVALLGHSAGAGWSEWAQQSDPRIKTIVAYDNLVEDSAAADGDPSSPGPNCNAHVASAYAPRVPALGFASDGPCTGNPTFVPADLKLSGFTWWHANGLSSADLVIAGSKHLDFETDGPEVVHQNVWYATQAWFDYWLGGDTTALSRLAEPTWNGVPRAQILSTQFTSAIATPAYDCLDLSTC